MKILGERFGKKYGKGKKSDMDFVKMDLSKVRRFQEELVVDVRNIKLMTQGITETIKTLQTKNETTPGHLCNNGNNTDNTNSNTNNDDNNNINNGNNNQKTENSLATPKNLTIPYSMSDRKKIQRVQKKTEKSEEDSGSETSSASSQDCSDENNRKSKRNQKRKKKSGQKNRKETDSDGSKYDTKTERLPYPVPRMTNPMQDFRQNNVYLPNPR